MKKEKLEQLKRWMERVFVEQPEPARTYSVPYVKPELRELSEEEINAIHERGYITPSEAYHEWKCMDLCAPGDAIGSAKERCYRFDHKCSDCLKDYANQKKEWVSLFENLQYTVRYDFRDKVLVKK